MISLHSMEQSEIPAVGYTPQGFTREEFRLHLLQAIKKAEDAGFDKFAHGLEAYFKANFGEGSR
jgi:hypothetical protein